MTPLPSARRAEEFADAVEALVAGATPRPAEAAGATSPLLQAVAALLAVPEPAPRPQFTDELRRRLLVEAASLAAGAPGPSQTAAQTAARTAARAAGAPLQGRRPGRLVAAATAFVVVGGSAGMATAAQRALPGDTLYSVKRALEGAELRLSTSDGGRGRDLLEQASSRLQEVEALLPATAEAGALPTPVAARLPATLDAFTGQALEGSGLLLESYERDQDPRDVVDVRAFAAASTTTLTQLAQSAPTDARDELAGAATAVQAMDARAVALCPTCGDGSPALQVPDDLTAPPADGDEALAGEGTSASPADAGSPDDDSSTAPDDEDDTDGQPDPSGGPSDGAPSPSGGPTTDGTDPTDDADGDDGATDGVTDPTDETTGGGPTDETDGATDETDGATDGTDGATDGTTDGVTPSPTEDVTDEPLDETGGDDTKNGGDPGNSSGSADPGSGTPGASGGNGDAGPGSDGPSTAGVTDAVGATTGAGAPRGLPRVR